MPLPNPFSARNRALRRAANHLEAGEPAAAAEALAPIAIAGCTDPDVFALYAEALSLSGDVERAVEQLRRAHELRPADTDNAASLYLNLLLRNDAAGARAVLERTLDAPDLDAGDLCSLGERLRDLGQPAGAALALERLVALDPDDPDVLNNFILSVDQSGDHDRALRLVEEALTRFPDEYLLAANRVSFLAKSGRVDTALRDGRAVMARWPERLGIVNTLAWYLLVDGGPDAVAEAVALLDSARGKELPEQLVGPFVSTNAFAQYRQGEHARGLALIRKLITHEREVWGEAFPDVIDAQERRLYGEHKLIESLCLHALGDRAAADAAFTEGVEYAPASALLALTRRAGLGA